MDILDFVERVDQARERHPNWFSAKADRFPGRKALADAEGALGAELPSEYAQFLERYGGGDFAFSMVYSLDPSSSLNIVAKNHLPWLNRADFIAIADNGAGDHYGFVVVGGECRPEVFLLEHEHATIESTGWNDLLEFLVATGLQY